MATTRKRVNYTIGVTEEAESIVRKFQSIISQDIQTESSSTQAEHCTEYWVQRGFQRDVVLNAFRIFCKRAKNFHAESKGIELRNSVQFKEHFWAQFYSIHFTNLERWLKYTGLEEKIDNLDDSVRILQLFLFYLVYGELNDFRGLKSILNLFYYICWQRFRLQKQDEAIKVCTTASCANVRLESGFEEKETSYIVSLVI